MERIAHHFDELRPLIPTFIAVTLSAITPIYAGAHASLSRPSSAAKSSKKSKSRRRTSSSSSDRQMEGLQPIDALLYPIMTGAVLTGLYYLIKYLQDPALLNKILNYYLSIFGSFSIWQLTRDMLTVCNGFIFPTRYSRSRKVWMVDEGQRVFAVREADGSDRIKTESTTSPLPGRLSAIPLPIWLSKALWLFREARTQPYAVVDIFAKHIGDAVIHVDDSAILATIVTTVAVIYYNLVDKPWWLTNLFGFSFCYTSLQLLSPTTFWTGTMILISLFFYDIYFVFFTPIMIEVATKLDIPAKLLIPKPADANQPAGKQALTLLGLGDIVLPGIMLGLALRFDLYMFYLRKQTSSTTKEGKLSTGKAEYVTATGSWGERFWLDSRALKNEGGYFPKTYFTAGLVGYIFAMMVTEVVMHVAKHGQPALLYLVPGVLGSLWGTAALRGEIKYMWAYTEDETGEKTDKDKDKNKEGGSKDVVEQLPAEQNTSPLSATDNDPTEANKQTDSTKSITSNSSSKPESKQKTGSEASDSRRSDSSKKPAKDEEKKIFSFSISLPDPLHPEPETEENNKEQTNKDNHEHTHSLGQQQESSKPLALSADSSSSNASSFEVVG